MQQSLKIGYLGWDRPFFGNHPRWDHSYGLTGSAEILHMHTQVYYKKFLTYREEVLHAGVHVKWSRSVFKKRSIKMQEIEKGFSYSPPRVIPASKHFFRRHEGQFFLLSLSMVQSFRLAHRYFCFPKRKKKYVCKCFIWLYASFICLLKSVFIVPDEVKFILYKQVNLKCVYRGMVN